MGSAWLPPISLPRTLRFTCPDAQFHVLLVDLHSYPAKWERDSILAHWQVEGWCDLIEITEAAIRLSNFFYPLLLGVAAVLKFRLSGSGLQPPAFPSAGSQGGS